MTRARLIAVALAAAGAVACSGEEDPCAFATRGPAWLAFASAEGGGWDVQVIRADGSCRRAITSDPAVDLNPAWAPNGVVAYESDRAPATSVWIHDVAAGTERRLDVGALRASSPAVSPDGAKLAFEGRAPGATTSGIYTVPLAGGTPVLLTPEDVPHGNGGPVFAPDGSRLYFVSNRNGPYEVFEVPAAGGAAVQVTTGSGILGKPAISPDGATLAFTRTSGASTEVVRYALGTGADDAARDRRRLRARLRPGRRTARGSRRPRPHGEHRPRAAPGGGHRSGSRPVPDRTARPPSRR